MVTTLPNKTVQEALYHLELVLQEAEETHNPLGIYAVLHHQVLTAVLESIKNEEFEHSKSMELVATIVVNRFLEAYMAYQSGQPCSCSWRVAFDSCLRKKLLLIQHFFMGINAQLNLDLGIALAKVAPGNELYMLEKDVRKYHRIVEEVLAETRHQLKLLSPLFWLTRVGGNKTQQIAHFSLKAAQQHAWGTAELLSNLSGARYQTAVDQIDGFVVKVTQMILKPSWFNWLLFNLVRLVEQQNTNRVISILKK